MTRCMIRYLPIFSVLVLTGAFAEDILEDRATNSSASRTVSWGTCPDGLPPGVDCGTIDVPLAYKPGNSTEADGDETVSLFLTRLNSTGNGTTGTTGSLFFNPGGPGVPASFLVAASQFVPNLGFSTAVRGLYDVIGLDPRGVGYSTPAVTCDIDIFNERVSTFVTDNATYNALVDHNRRLGESCANLTGPLINHLDSIHVAKDFDVVRRALDAPKFNYFGMSYGSLLGQSYVELFPRAVGRMSLDGLIDHSQSEITTLLTEASTYETTLNKFFEWCDTNSTCALNGNNSKQAVDDLLARADLTAIPAPSCNGSCQPNVTGEDMRYNMQDFLQFVDLTFTSNWIQLGAAYADAIDGNATALSTPLASDDDATSIMGSPFAYLAIGCQDWLHRGNRSTDIAQRLQSVRPFAPQTLGASQTFYYQSTCLGWPAPLTNPQRTLNRTVDRAPPILLSNSVYDPSCSIVWANGLREQMPTAVSITRNGTGHTSHFLLGEVSAVIDNFLATGKLPPDGSIYQT